MGVEVVSYVFEDLVPQHRPQLVVYALKLCRGSKEAAEDVVQQGLLNALEAWDGFVVPDYIDDVEVAVRAWLFTIVYNVFVNTWRRNARHQTYAVDRRDDVMEATYGSPDDGYDPRGEPDDEFSDEVTDALMGLDDAQRKVVDLATDGMSYKEIAAKLNIPIGTVMSRLNRARRRLEAQLSGFATREYGFGRERAARVVSTDVRVEVGGDAVEDDVALEPPESVEPDSDGVDGVVGGLDVEQLLFR